MKLTKTQRTQGRQLREEIAWVEDKLAKKHPISRISDLETKLIDLYVEYKKLYPETLFDTEGNVWSRTADIRLMLLDK